MTAAILCSGWPIQLREPQVQDPVERIRVQEEFLGQHLAPRFLGAPPSWVASLHSFHFMRYLDPTHLAPVKGIVVELRLLGDAAVLAQAEPDVDAFLAQLKAQSVVLEHYRKARNDWLQTTLAAYGGPDAGEAFARFLASSSQLTLLLLRAPRVDFQARQIVLNNWAHCFGLVTKCQG